MYWIKQPTEPYNVLLYIPKTSYTFYDFAFGQYVSHIELTCMNSITQKVMFSVN